MCAKKKEQNTSAKNVYSSVFGTSYAQILTPKGELN